MAGQEGACVLIAADDSLVKKMVQGQLGGGRPYDGG